MENLNDLIWTDETGNENGGADSQGSNMHNICMIAFCGVVRGSSDGGSYDTAASDFACSRDWSTGPNTCA